MYRTLCLDFKQCYDNPLIEPRGIIMRDHYLEFLWREFLYEGKLKSHYYDSNKYLVIVLMYYSLLRSQSEALLNPKHYVLLWRTDPENFTPREIPSHFWFTIDDIYDIRNWESFVGIIIIIDKCPDLNTAFKINICYRICW